MIIRLIDIVLLVLFGFISVSNLDDQTKVELPRSEEIPRAELETKDRVTISVDVMGEYYLQGSFKPSSLDEVAQYLDDEKETWGSREMRILIRSDSGTPMASIKALVKLCSERGMDASFVVIKVEKRL